jgi:hypothetical protein
MIFARWSAEASPEDRKRINAFKPRLLAVLINNGVKEMVGGNAAENVTQSVTNAVGNFFGFGKQK